jgi:hypothetical protein
MRSSTIAVALAAAALLATTTAQAQSNRSEPPPSSSPSNRNCSPGLGNAAPRSNETTGNRPLSEQLSESKGVICPPAGVDPGIAVPPVGGGRTPVIPPPGTPGGDPNLQPK